METFKLFFIRHLPLGRSRGTSLGLLCLLGFWHFAPRVAVSQIAVQRDQQAITILNQTIAAGGGQQLLTSIQDFTETGSVRYYWADQQITGNVTVKGRGAHQFRIDAELAKGKRTTVANGEGGIVTEENGLKIPILRQGVADLGSLTLPYIPLIAAIQDPSTSIVYGGLVTHSDVSAYDIRLVKVFTKEKDPSGTRGEQEARDFYIDPKTFLISAVSDRMHHRSPDDEGVPHEVLYSNYQPEGGIVAPLTIMETVRGVTGVTITVNEVTLNPGLSDSDFAW